MTLSEDLAAAAAGARALEATVASLTAELASERTRVASLERELSECLGPAPAPRPALVGVYRGAQRPEYLPAHEQWLTRSVDVVMDMLATGALTTWAAWTNPGSRVAVWGDRDVVFTVGLMPRTSPVVTLAEVASGAHDDKWRAFAASMIQAGRGDARIRLGHEFNHTWEPWTATGGREGSFAAAYRRAVDVLRASGARFRFTWNLLSGVVGINADAAYPGDGYVDVVGLDVYDSRRGLDDVEARWRRTLAQPHGLDWLAAFSKRHGKPASLDEWALRKAIDPAVKPYATDDSGDNALFVERIFDWVESHDVEYATYFDSRTVHGNTDSRITQPGGPYPKASAAYKRRVLARQ